jgi:hypothetical protein
MVDPGGNDVLGAGFVTVSDKSTFRFEDSFNFSGLNYDSITSFKLTLTFSDTNKTFWGVSTEDWRVRPGGSDTLVDMNNVGSQTTQTFTITSSFDTFQGMVTNKNFYFWLADEAFGANDFKLYSATLEIIGTQSAAAVPIPAAGWLLGTGIVGLVGFRRKLRG